MSFNMTFLQVPEDECKLSQTQRDYISDASKKDKQSLSFIYQATDENTSEKISRANTTKEAWEMQEDCSYKTVDKVRKMLPSNLFGII